MKMSRDTRPVSMLEQPAFTKDMFVGGALVVLAAHIGLPLIIFAITTLLASTVAGRRPQSFVEEHVVIATFVRKGVKKDPKKLPDRVVPKKSTAPDDSIVVSKNPDPPPDKPKDEKKPENATEDLVKRFGDPNQDFAEILEREQQGDPDGLEDGTDTEAKAGNIYFGQLVSFIRRGWEVPTTLGDTNKLMAVFSVEITRDCKVGESRLVKSSGEPLFDNSVEERFQELRTLGTTLPEPPPEIAGDVLGQTITLNVKGKGGQ